MTAPFPRRIGLLTATMLVVASMVGTGVFTTTGFLVRDIGSPSAVLACWAVGGVLALAGALSYGELGAALPCNGGEYQLLSRIYHPALGFVGGFASLFVGFCAPLAAAALAFSAYLSALVPGLPGPLVAVCLVLSLSVLHALKVSMGGAFQDFLTLGKILLIVGFIVAGLVAGSPSRILGTDGPGLLESVFSAPFAVGLVYVSYSYSGWNAAAYVAGEVRNPQRNLPLSLLIGTLGVAALYFGLNMVFLGAVSASELSGVLEVGHVAATGLFGSAAGGILSGIIALGLISTVGAFIMTGPRVNEAMGLDYPRLRFVTGRATEGGPLVAIGLQAAVAVILILSASFDALLTYVGITLSLFTALTVAGVFVLRLREPGLNRPYRVLGYPVVPLVALALMAWMIVQAVISQPASAFFGLLTILAGLLVWWFVRPQKGAPEGHGATDDGTSPP